MCTSLTLTAADHTTILARTMDFPNVDPWSPTKLPAGTPWQPILGDSQTTHFNIVGASRHLDGHYLFGDGINAAGLSCAELYLPGRVQYYDDPQAGKTNLTPQDFILWVLSGHTTVAEVLADLPRVALVAHVWYVEHKVYPFHWVLADATGATAYIEPTTRQLTATANPIQVMTNTPTLAAHYDNLAKVLQVPDTKQSTLSKAAEDWLNASMPLPEGSIPTNRFVRTAINRLGHPQPVTGTDAENAAFDYLKQVVTPRQENGQQKPNHNFTHYISFMNVSALTYTHVPIETMRSQSFSVVDLT